MARTTTPDDRIWSGAEAEEELEIALEVEARPRNPIVGFLLNPYLTLVSRFVLGSIFVLSGSAKLGNHSGFADSIRSYEVGLPDGVVNTMATVLPVVELGLGIWILAGLFTRFSAAVIGGLMAVFMVAIGQAWARGIEADCGCFAGAAGAEPSFAETVIGALGPVGAFLNDAQIGPTPLIRDALFLLMALHLFFVPTVWSLDQVRARQNDD
jgi:putative oxidoreductase